MHTDHTDHTDQPVYWFTVLEIARERSDFEAAADAVRQLERLGVRVTFGKPDRRREVAAR